MIRNAVLACCIGAAGCASSPPENFYTLSAGGGPAPAGARSALVVAVDPVALVELVDRPQMVVRVAANRLNILEHSRWAEPLRAGIARVVAENLVHLLGTPNVTAYPREPRGEVDYRVVLDVTQFDAIAGEGVLIAASWTLRPEPAGTLRSGRTIAREAVSAAGVDALVAADSRALETISRDIAQAIAGNLPPPR